MLACELKRYAATANDANQIASSYSGDALLGKKVLPKVSNSPYESFVVVSYWRMDGAYSNRWHCVPSDCRVVEVPPGMEQALWGP